MIGKNKNDILGMTDEFLCSIFKVIKRHKIIKNFRAEFDLKAKRPSLKRDLFIGFL